MPRKLSEAVQDGSKTNVDPTIIQACLAEYTEVDTEMKRLAQRQAAMLKRYEGQGVNVRSVKNAHRFSKQDRQAARSQAQSDVRYLIVTGVLKPADDEWVRKVSQSDMFAPNDLNKTSPELDRARAYSDGYNSGRHGADPDGNRFTPGTVQYVAWAEGCVDGNADRALKPGAAKVKEASAEPRRRGRPPRGSVLGNGNGAHA